MLRYLSSFGLFALCLLASDLLHGQTDPTRIAHSMSADGIVSQKKLENSISIDLYAPIASWIKKSSHQPWEIAFTREAKHSKSQRVFRAWRYGIVGLVSKYEEDFSLSPANARSVKNSDWQLGLYGGHRWSFALGKRFSIQPGIDLMIHYQNLQSLDYMEGFYASREESRADILCAKIVPSLYVGFRIARQLSCSVGLQCAVAGGYSWTETETHNPNMGAEPQQFSSRLPLILIDIYPKLSLSYHF